MKTIKLRDFQRNICKVIYEHEVLHVVDGDGVLIGIWSPSFVGQVSTSQFMANAEALKPILSDKPRTLVGHAEASVKDEIDEIFGPSIDLCYKCNSAGKEVEAKYKGETWDEDGEWVTISICEACYKKFKPPKFKLIK